MSIFNNTALTYGDEIVACEGYDVELGGNFDAMMESFDDDLAIIEAMHTYEMAELEAIKAAGGNTNVSTPAMEGALGDIWQKIKTFFANLAKKIMAFFKSVADYMFAITHSGTEFYNKYHAKLSHLSKVDFKYTGYQYKIDNLDGADIAENAANSVEKNIDQVKAIKIEGSDVYTKFNELENKFDSEKNTLLNDLRAKLSGESSAEKYQKALFKKFRYGEEDKKEIKVNSLSDALKFLERSDSLNKDIKSANDKAKKSLSDISRKIDDMANEAKKADSGEGKDTKLAAKKAAMIRSQLSTYQAINSVYTMYINAFSSAVREAVSTYKSNCLKALRSE